MTATTTQRSRWLVLLALLFAALAPRCFMAYKIGGLCPDAVVYIRIAQSYEQRTMLDDKDNRFALNLYPALLVVVHRAGVDWEQAGKFLGVAFGTLTVLPLFGLVRRQFNEPTAVAAAALYAFHAEFVRWTPEGLRDPTFWFLWTLALYLLWRVREQPRIALYLAAGITMALTVLTRTEGLLLLVPFGFWGVCRVRCGCDNATNRSSRRKLILGGVIALAVFPVLLFLVSRIWFPQYSPWSLVRTKPLELISHWWNGHAAPSSGNLLSPDEAKWRTLSLLGAYLTAASRGFTLPFAILLLCGFRRARKAFFRLELCPLWITSLGFLAAIWIHNYVANETSKRYFLSIVLMTTPWAAMGLQRLAELFASWAMRWRGSSNAQEAEHAAKSQLGTRSQRGARSHRGARSQHAVRWMPLLLYMLVSLGDILHADYSQRAANRAVGEAIAARLAKSKAIKPTSAGTTNSGPIVLGPPGVTGIVAWYAQGEERRFADGVAVSTIETAAADTSIDALLLPKKPDGTLTASTVDWTRRAGYEQIDNANLAGGLRHIAVFVRTPTPEKLH